MKVNIIRLLLYSDIFEHPLTLEEIALKLGAETSALQLHLKELVDEDLIQNNANYYSILLTQEKINRRKKGSEKAQQLIPKARNVARLISKFPYVEGVGVSGSLSKGVLHDDGDFDFFIITTPQRLWIARSFLIVYKKIFLLNSKKYFCVNYFIDSDNLEIQEKNIFTATEISSLLPMEGPVFQKFRHNNQWVNNFAYYANQESKTLTPLKKPLISRALVRLLTGNFGNWLDTAFLKLTLRRWRKKFSHFDQNKFDLTLKTRKYVSKHHPNDFQQKVLSSYSKNLDAYIQTHQKNLMKHDIKLV